MLDLPGRRSSTSSSPTATRATRWRPTAPADGLRVALAATIDGGAHLADRAAARPVRRSASRLAPRFAGGHRAGRGADGASWSARARTAWRRPPRGGRAGRARPPRPGDPLAAGRTAGDGCSRPRSGPGCPTASGPGSPQPARRSRSAGSRRPGRRRRVVGRRRGVGEPARRWRSAATAGATWTVTTPARPAAGAGPRSHRPLGTEVYARWLDRRLRPATDRRRGLPRPATAGHRSRAYRRPDGTVAATSCRCSTAGWSPPGRTGRSAAERRRPWRAGRRRYPGSAGSCATRRRVGRYDLFDAGWAAISTDGSNWQKFNLHLSGQRLGRPARGGDVALASGSTRCLRHRPAARCSTGERDPGHPPAVQLGRPAAASAVRCAGTRTSSPTRAAGPAPP